jgi:predicted phosphodiesterase
MKLAILSDIHANIEALQATARALSAEPVDEIVCLGDIVGYNADPEPCVALLRELGATSVAGNHDRAVCGQITTEGFSPIAARAAAWTQMRLAPDALEYLSRLPLKARVGSDLLVVHGALHPEVGCETVRLDTDEARALSFEALVRHPSGIRICAFGHTHRLGVYELRDGVVRSRDTEEVALRDDAVYLVNPGTVGQPRSADTRATYMVLDTDRRSLAVRRVAYDHRIPLAKTRKAGLAPPFSFLPEPVRSSLKQGARALRIDGLLKRAVG